MWKRAGLAICVLFMLVVLVPKIGTNMLPAQDLGKYITFTPRWEDYCGEFYGYPLTLECFFRQGDWFLGNPPIQRGYLAIEWGGTALVRWNTTDLEPGAYEMACELTILRPDGTSEFAEYMLDPIGVDGGHDESRRYSLVAKWQHFVPVSTLYLPLIFK